MSTENNQKEPRLRIGAVSRLTGLSVHALRKWEERYAAVQPFRTPGGERLYSRQDVQRLALIKRLTRSGAPLGEIARMPLEELEQIAESIAPDIEARDDAAERVSVVRVGVVGDSLPTLLKGGPRAASGLEVVASAGSIGDLRQQIENKAIDLLVLEFPTIQGDLSRDVARSIRDLGAQGAVVVYGFAARATLDTLRQMGIALLRAPIDPAELEHVARDLVQQPTGRRAGPRAAEVEGPDIPAPRFSREAVARIAMSTPAMRCECPHHLVDIIASLVAFERYSIECENRNTEDAALHRFLAVTAGHARCAFEDALERVAKAEGIDLSAS